MRPSRQQCELRLLHMTFDPQQSTIIWSVAASDMLLVTTVCSSLTDVVEQGEKGTGVLQQTFVRMKSDLESRITTVAGPPPQSHGTSLVAVFLSWLSVHGKEASERLCPCCNSCWSVYTTHFCLHPPSTSLWGLSLTVHSHIQEAVLSVVCWGGKVALWSLSGWG